MATIKIGTWNVEYARGSDENDQRRRVLQAKDASIWVLTESHDDLDLGSGYTAVRTGPWPVNCALARWTTIWSKHPVVKKVATHDAERTVAAIVEAPVGQLLIYGTVMPWQHDGVPEGEAKGWERHHRAVEQQAKEWANLLGEHRDVTGLVVAGDFNMNLGGAHFYGTEQGRGLLRAGLKKAGLVCLTAADRIRDLESPPIDHVCVSEHIVVGHSVVEGWEGTVDGVKLSDHSGVLVELVV